MFVPQRFVDALHHSKAFTPVVDAALASICGARGGGWLGWCASLTVSAFRDPEYDYWQVLAAQQTDDSLQFFWRSCVLDAGRSRSLRYLNLGLLALGLLVYLVAALLRPEDFS